MLSRTPLKWNMHLWDKFEGRNHNLATSQLVTIVMSNDKLNYHNENLIVPKIVAKNVLSKIVNFFPTPEGYIQILLFNLNAKDGSMRGPRVLSSFYFFEAATQFVIAKRWAPVPAHVEIPIQKVHGVNRTCCIRRHRSLVPRPKKSRSSIYIRILAC